jgi:hypothetical protein
LPRLLKKSRTQGAARSEARGVLSPYVAAPRKGHPICKIDGLFQQPATPPGLPTPPHRPRRARVNGAHYTIVSDASHHRHASVVDDGKERRVSSRGSGRRRNGLRAERGGWTGGRLDRWNGFPLSRCRFSSLCAGGVGGVRHGRLCWLELLRLPDVVQREGQFPAQLLQSIDDALAKRYPICTSLTVRQVPSFAGVSEATHAFTVGVA